MRLSLVIPTYNRSGMLRRCLQAATTQDHPDYEVIVVDDCSSDGTWELLQLEFPQVHRIRLERNRGPAAARNRGIEAATGAAVAFTDDDCLLPVGFLSALAAGYERHPEAAGVGGQLWPPQGPGGPQCNRAVRSVRLPPDLPCRGHGLPGRL